MPQFLLPVSGHGHDFGPKFIVKDKEDFRFKGAKFQIENTSDLS